MNLKAQTLTRLLLANSGDLTVDGSYAHAFRVAAAFKSSEGKSVAFMHDLVEDGYVTLVDLLDLGFPDTVVDAVSTISRRPDEPYFNYIARVINTGGLALQVKEVDLMDNHARVGRPELKPRYLKALKMIAESR